MLKPLVSATVAALFASILTPTITSALASGFVTTKLDVHAGAGVQYPIVALFPSGSQVTVIGCTSDFNWCKVTAGGIRGWVYGRDLEVALPNLRERAPAIGVPLGLPVISFEVGRAMDNHYWGRSWYDQRSSYGGRHNRVAPFEQDLIAPHPVDEATPQKDVASPIRVEPRHVGPQENRPGDLRFLPRN